MLKPFCFAKSVLYPSNSRAKPHALYVDPLVLNALFQFETLCLLDLDCAGGFTVVDRAPIAAFFSPRSVFF